MLNSVIFRLFLALLTVFTQKIFQNVLINYFGRSSPESYVGDYVDGLGIGRINRLVSY